MIFKRLKKPDPKQEQEHIEALQKEKISGKDLLAMIISAFISLFLPVVLILLVICGAMLWLFGIL